MPPCFFGPACSWPASMLECTGSGWTGNEADQTVWPGHGRACDTLVGRSNVSFDDSVIYADVCYRRVIRICLLSARSEDDLCAVSDTYP